LPRGARTVTIESLSPFATWGKAIMEGKIRPEVIEVAHLEGTGLEVLAAQEPAPVIVKIPHGMGQITLFALSLESPAIKSWSQRQTFWKTLYEKLAPRNLHQTEGVRPGRGFRGEEGPTDLGTDLERELDKFDVPNISFGWVALFIFIYILIV